MPAKVSESERAMVTAGLANEVDAVNQYAEEPIGRRDVEPDRVGDCGGIPRETAEDREQQPEGGDKFGQPLPGARPYASQRDLPHRQLEHRMRSPHPNDRPR